MTDLTQDLAALDAALYMCPTPDPWQALRPESEGDVTVAGPGGVPIAKCGRATSVLVDILPRLKSGDSYGAHPGIEPE